MKSKYYFIFIPVILVASYLLGKNIDYQYNKDIDNQAALIKSSCDPTKTACNISFAGYMINYKILGNPSALKKFTVELQSFDAINSVKVDFSMRGMDMGKNDYYLVNNGSNNWTREVVLPICSLGQNNWINQLEIELDGRYWLVEFSFDQKN